MNQEKTKIENLWLVQDDSSFYSSLKFIEFDLNGGNIVENQLFCEKYFPVKPSQITKEWLNDTLINSGVIPKDIKIEDISINSDLGE